MPIIRPAVEKFAEYGVKDGSTQRATLGLGSVQLTRKFICRWEETGLLAAGLLGYARITRDGSGNPVRLERLLPSSLPADPALICTQLNLMNGHVFTGAIGDDPARPGGRFPADAPETPNRLSDQSVGSQYRKAVLEAVYERPRFAMLADEDVGVDEEYKRYTETMPPQIGIDVIALPGLGYKYVTPAGVTPPPTFDSGKLTIQIGLPLMDAYRDIRVRWSRVPASLVNEDDPSPWLQRLMGLTGGAPLLGSVNKTVFKGWKIGTAWLLNAEWELRPAPFVTYTPTAGGGMTYLSQYDAQEADIIFTFRVRNNGVPWNWFYYSHPQTPGVTNRSGWFPISKSGTYYTPGSVPSADAPKDEKEFRDLFKVTA